MIEIVNLSKSFKKYIVPFNSLKSFMINHKRYNEEQKKIEELHVIDQLTMNINDGEILCIVGKNGSGKSTLAKLIAGTIEPTKGKIEVKGKIVPFLELGVAFSNELTGRDNVLMNGVLLGLSRKYIREKMNDIFEFAEVSDFIDTPMKYYSSGMQMRLAFSIGMHADGDIYIFDEILAVGDTNFQQKCFASFHRLIEQGKTIILITHDLFTVQKYANRVLYLKDGMHEIIDDEVRLQNITTLFD